MSVMVRASTMSVEKIKREAKFVLGGACCIDDSVATGNGSGNEDRRASFILTWRISERQSRPNVVRRLYAITGEDILCTGWSVLSMTQLTRRWVSRVVKKGKRNKSRNKISLGTRGTFSSSSLKLISENVVLTKSCCIESHLFKTRKEITSCTTD